MKIMSFGLAKAHQTADRRDAAPFLRDVYNKGTRASKRLAGVPLYTMRGLLPQNAPDTTQPDDDVYNLGTCRKTESAGNGVLSSGEKNFSVHKTYMNFLRPRKSAPEAALYALRESLLPENGTDATPFSSDVYNKGTRARKRLADVSLYGRSMVEMLGVLAIIGVLSVGAISGYSKAMKKYWENKFIAATSELIANAQTIIATSRIDFGQSNSYRLSREMAKLNLIPPPYKYNGYYIEFIIPYHERPTSWSQVDAKKEYIQIYLYGIDNEICHLLLTQDWTPLNYQYVVVMNNDLYPVFRGKLSLEQIDNICNIKSTDDENVDVYGRSAIILGFGI